ncbi:MAG: hypothetical protein V4583_17555 [Pseudomonadota bacterium]
MQAFDLDLVETYASFSRSFSKVRAPDLKAAIDAHYTDGHFWPDAWRSLNPQFMPGKTSAALASEGALDPLTAQIFRRKGQPIRFHAHRPPRRPQWTSLMASTWRYESFQ